MHRKFTTALAAVAVCTGAFVVAAQASQGTMGKMDKPAAKTYTGCIAAGQTTGTFTLTHAAEAGMGKDSMSKDGMKKDAMAHDMADKTLALEGKNVDFSKHVGHKVSVTGNDASSTMGKPDGMAPSNGMGKDLPSFSVTSIKAIEGTCGM